MERFIGLDVHAASTTCAVIDARGKRVRVDVLETNGQALIEFLKLQPGTLRLCMEEGTQALWLAEILTPHVEQLAVVHVTESRGPKDDERDALALAEQMRSGKLETTVYKHVGPFGALRNLVKTHAMIVRDVVRTQNRIKALFRSRGVPIAGKAVYATKDREVWVAKLPTTAQSAGRLLYAQYDAGNDVRIDAEKTLVEESHRHPITRVLETCPGVGPIRAAQIVSVVVTPDRFRKRQQFWSYCGLGLVMRSSSDWVKNEKGTWARTTVNKTRGLNFNHNHLLKQVFKGAATTIVTQLSEHPLHADYQRMLDGGTKPNLAKLTLARKVASIVLAMWKHQEVYDTVKHSKPSSSLVSMSGRQRPDTTKGTDRTTLERRVGIGGEHPLDFWTKSATDRHDTRAQESPRIGYAPPENRMKPWHIDALIEGWFPLMRENKTASVSREW